jgi:hypothetical protein
VLAAKSAKILPTMAVASLWLRKRFSSADWGAALLSALGLALCLRPEAPSSAAAGAAGASRWLGALLVAGALACDAGAANASEAVMLSFAAPASELALWSYGVATAASLAHGLLVDELAPGLAAVARAPAVAAAVAVFAAASLASTWATLELIAAAGASSAMFVAAVAKAAVIGASLALAPAAAARTTRTQAAGISLVLLAASLAACARRARSGGGSGGGASDSGGSSSSVAAAAAADAAADADDGATVQAPSSPVGSARERRSVTGRPAGAPPSPQSTPARGAFRRASAGEATTPILRLLRSESSRALSAVSIGVLGIARPEPRFEALSPVVRGGRRHRDE